MEDKAYVTFRFKADIGSKRTVKLVGNLQELGAWNPLYGIQLQTSADQFPIWSSKQIFLPIGEQILYKYIFQSQGDYQWEPLIENRKLNLKDQIITIEDFLFSKASHHIVMKNEFPSYVINPVEKLEFSIKQSVEFSGKQPLIIASMNLPITLSRNTNPNGPKFLVQPATGFWMPTLYKIVVNQGIQFKWVGFPNIFPQSTQQEQELSELLETQYNIIPIFISPQTMEKHRTFCSSVLYPIFNNIIHTDAKTIPQYNFQLWQAYKTVNSKCAEAISSHWQHHMVWIHQYQLLLTPNFLARRSNEVFNIGLYLHSSFPSSEIYRILPHREAILRSLLCCDLLGFHLFEYARHFLAACKRLLGLQHYISKGGYLSLKYYGRHILLKIGHLGIQPDIIDELIKSPSHSTALERLQQKYQRKKVILGIDAANRLSGIPMKLKAFRAVMNRLINKKQSVRLVQIITEARNNNLQQEKQVINQILQQRNQINQEFGTDLVEVEYKTISLQERYAFMKIATGIINSCFREGLCLIPFEFLFVTQDFNASVIISQFAGVSRALNSVKRVNPFDIMQLEDQIYNMIENYNQTVSNKRRKDIEYINTHTTHQWARDFLTDLKRAQKDTQNYNYGIHGLGENLKLVALNKHFSHLTVTDLTGPYQQSLNRVFFLDYYGTLIDLQYQSSLSGKIKLVIEDLCNDQRNTVFVITGRQKDEVDQWLGQFKKIGIAAQYGSFIKWNQHSQWSSMTSANKTWKTTAKEIIKTYVQRTEGSSLEVKEFSVVFQYKNTDWDLGSLQAKELVQHLEILLKPFLNQCEVSCGIGYVEVKPRGIDKGTTVYRILEHVYQRKGPVDFIVAMGDDNADQQMFRMIFSMNEEKSPIFAKTMKSFTCTVGRKPSEAHYYVNDVKEVKSILEHLKGWSAKAKKNYSYGDLTLIEEYQRQKKDPWQVLNPVIDEEDEEIFSPIPAKKPMI